jgi:sugar O-acyltransferase (sialic acid O-acetyltransferase NeuD family)
MSTKKIPVKKNGILIFGASGHAKVVMDIAEKSGYLVQALFDDNVALHGRNVYGYEVAGGKEVLVEYGSLLKKYRIVVAIGNNPIRVEVAEWIIAQGGSLSEALIHPSAQLARGASVGDGSVVMAGAVINSDSRTGRNAIINTGALIDHDCIIDDAVHVAPGATLCGGVEVGNNSLIGAGAVVHPNLHIGKNVTIGAGSTVLGNIGDGMTVVGSPAKPIR